MRLLDCVKIVSEHLEKAGIEGPFAEAEMLVLHAAGIDRLAAYVENPEVGQALFSNIRKLTAKRADGKPLQYIVGSVDFLGLKMKVGRGVLIPRPETELLAEEAIKRVHDSRLTTHDSLRFLDLCTGSGCLALALAQEFPDAEICAVDLSKTAIRYARMNAETNGINNVKLFCGSLFHPVKDLLFDIIVSNPPYIRTKEIGELQREIRDWEPRRALDGGGDGLDFYRKIFPQAKRYLKEGGSVLVEVGFGQADDVKGIARRGGFGDVVSKKDFAGIERIVKAYV